MTKKTEIRHIQSHMRKIRSITIREIEEKTGQYSSNIYNHENLITIPNLRTIIKVSDALNVNPEVLLYSYGILPNKITKIIQSDPFYYMEKIEKLYYNHDKRYGTDEVDLNKLNMVRVFEYVTKGDKDAKS